MNELGNMTGLEAIREARRQLADFRQNLADAGPWAYDAGTDGVPASVVDEDGGTILEVQTIGGSGRLVVGMHAMLGSIDAWWADADETLTHIEATGSAALASLLNVTGGGRHADAIAAARQFLHAVTS